MLSPREYLWKLRRGHWVAYGALIAAVSVTLPASIYLVTTGFNLSEDVEKGLNAVLVPGLTALLWICWYGFSHFGSGLDQIAPSKAKKAVDAFRCDLERNPILHEIRDTVEVYSVANRAPRVTAQETGARGVDVNFFEKLAGTNLRELMPSGGLEDGRINAPHAFVFDEHIPPDYQTSVSEITYVNGSYNLLTAIAKTAQSKPVEVPRTLGAGALVICPATNEILILNKAKPTQKPVYHVFGGNFEPRLQLPGASYDLDLEVNAQREVIEESGLAITVDDCPLVMHLEKAGKKLKGWEAEQRFLPVHFLGALIERSQLDDIRGSEEGSVKTIHFDILAEELIDIDNWIPAAWVTVMVWLKLGSPCQQGRPVLAKRTAGKIYQQVMNGLARQA